MRNLVGAVLAAVVVAFIGGCSPPQPAIVATWSGQTTGPAGEPGTITITFRPDKTVRQEFKYNNETTEMEGTYTATDGKMTLIFTKVTINGKDKSPPTPLKKNLGYVIDRDQLTLGESAANNFKLHRVER